MERPTVAPCGHMVRSFRPDKIMSEGDLCLVNLDIGTLGSALRGWAIACWWYSIMTVAIALANMHISETLLGWRFGMDPRDVMLRSQSLRSRLFPRCLHLHLH